MNGIRRRVRPAFTLIELLVVIMIIALLVVIGGSAAIRFMGGSSTAATRTTLDRVGIRFSGQWSAVADKARRETIPDAIHEMAGRDADRARVIYVKLRLKQAFPQSFYEALYPARDWASSVDYLPPLKAYEDQLRARGIKRTPPPPTYNPQAPAPAPGAHESAACLYLALRYGPDGTSDDELGIRGSTKEVSGFTCATDGWGNPLVFCRWPYGDHSGPSATPPVPPTGASLANPEGYQAGFKDPGDPKGLLNDPAWMASAGGQAFQRICHPLYPRASSAVPPQTVNLAPILLSAGPDKQLGADAFSLAKTSTAANDNVISGRIR